MTALVSVELKVLKAIFSFKKKNEVFRCTFSPYIGKSVAIVHFYVLNIHFVFVFVIRLLNGPI